MIGVNLTADQATMARAPQWLQLYTMACGIATTTTRLKHAVQPVLWEKAHQSRSRTRSRSRAEEEPRAPHQVGQQLRHVLEEVVPGEWPQT